MARRVTRWEPDTCRCVIDMEWDDTEVSDTKTMTPFAILPCAIHAGHPDKETVFDEVRKENKTKNQAVGTLLELHPSIDPEREIGWGFNQSRDVVLSVPKLTGLEKAALAQALRGLGRKVTVS